MRLSSHELFKHMRRPRRGRRLTRVLQTFLFEVTPNRSDPFTIVTLLLMAIRLMAAWLPARRATRIGPCAALHAE